MMNLLATAKIKNLRPKIRTKLKSLQKQMKELLKHKTNIVIVLSFWEIQSGDEATWPLWLYY